jgi:hypothetical protein
MSMISYAVYDVGSGEVVHLHVEPAGLDSSPEEIIQIADPRGGRRLEVVPLPSEGMPAETVRVVDRELRPAATDAGSGGAGGAGGLIEPMAPRRYEFRGGDAAHKTGSDG